MKSAFAVVFALTALSAQAFAAENVSTSQTGASILDSTYFNLFTVFHGPNTSDMSGHTVDRNGAVAKGGINFDNEITTAYMFTKDFGLGPDIPFVYAPVYGGDFTMGDLGVKAFQKHLVSTGGLDIYGNIYAQFSTSQYSRDRGQDLAIKSTPAVRYSLAGTRWTFGTWNEIKAYLGVTRDKAFKLYTLPYANYQLTQSLSLNVGYEMEWDHMVGMPGYLNFMTYQTDLQPGFVYFITPKILVNPYLQVFTTNKLSSDALALGAVVSATL